MTTSKQVLLVDGDTILLEMLREQLSLHEEFAIVSAETGAKALELALAGHFDATLLDVGLPDMDGREVCRLMRSNGLTSPIIMFTGLDIDADTILGAGCGANDCITKPFRLAVLLAMVRAQIRHHECSDDAVCIIGPYTFQPRAKLLVNNNDEKKVRLTDKETEILKYLYRSSEKVVGRNVLLDDVWGYNSNVTTHTLETHVYRLRQKIEIDPSDAKILATEPGGYRLVL